MTSRPAAGADNTERDVLPAASTSLQQ